MADYGKIINKSIETTKKFKWLWIYGLVLGAAGGTGSGGGSNFSDTFSDASPTPKPNLDNLFNNLPSTTPNPTDVLGTFTSDIAEWFKNISPTHWLLLFFGALALIVLGIGISWVLSSWAQGGLIGGLKMAHKDEDTNLKNTSKIGMANIKPLIKLGLAHFLVALVGSIGLVILIFVFSFISVLLGENGKFVNVLLIIVGIFGGLYVLINYALTYVYAQRYVVLEKLATWDAWKSGWKLATKNFFPSIVMGLISAILSGAFGCVTMLASLIILGIPAAIFIVPMVSKQEFKLGLTIPVIVLVIIFFMVNLVVRAITVVFTASNWNLFFEEITKTFDTRKGSSNEK